MYHAPCGHSLSSKSHCLQDLLIEKTKSHNPILCKNIFRVKTSKFPRSCNTSSPVCTTCCCDGKRSRDNRIIELSEDRTNLCTKICSVTQEAKYTGDDFFPQAYIHFDKSLRAKCSGEWILGVVLIEFMKVTRHSKFQTRIKSTVFMTVQISLFQGCQLYLY